MSDNNQSVYEVAQIDDIEQNSTLESNSAEHITAEQTHTTCTVETPADASKQKASGNRILVELQNFLSVVCYEAINKKDMKRDDIMMQMHAKLFSISTRMGYAEQLIRGEGHFSNMFGTVPV